MDGQNFNNGNETNQQDANQQPVYQQQPTEQPVYQQQPTEQPVYQQPVYQQPAYQQPVNQQPVYQQPVYQQPVYQQPVASESKIHGLSIAGFVVGLIALLTSCIFSWVSALIGIVALVLSIVGQAKKKSGMGIAAIIISAVAIIAGFLFVVVYVAVLSGASSVLNELSNELRYYY